MRAIEKRILEFAALAAPVNTNTPACCCNVRAASGPHVEALLRELTAIQPRARTYEAPPMLRMAGLRPSPAWRKMIASKA